MVLGIRMQYRSTSPKPTLPHTGKPHFKQRNTYDYCFTVTNAAQCEIVPKNVEESCSQDSIQHMLHESPQPFMELYLYMYPADVDVLHTS